MATICTICARGGSTGVARKNVRQLHGKPLIGWTIEQALASPSIDAVYVSTDDDEIARIAVEFGASAPYQRPPELATASAAKLPVIGHLIEYLETSGVEVTRIVDLDPTSPLRTVDDIEAAISLLHDDVDVVITAYPSDKNPYFNMVEQKLDGTFGLVVASDAVSRQSAPDVYSMNASIYVWHRHTFSKGLWNGRTSLYEMPRDRSVDIDSELDFKIVELLMDGQGDS
jgi:CMP-N,N'-diacetyllegionaminic acid synthase